MAVYIRDLVKNTGDSHQTDPGYVLTFIRWSNRDTVNYQESAQETRNPLVVINDAISVQVNESKSSLTGSANIVLKAGDLNYATAVAPGDYLIVNLLNDEDAVRSVSQRALAGQRINRYEDGFRGLYKVQKVRRQIQTDPATGKKQYQFLVHAFSFSELNTTIYYNPTAVAAFRESERLFISKFADFWNEKTTSFNNKSNVQDVLINLTKALLGTGLQNKDDLTISATQNAQFVVPSLVGSLLGRGGRNLTIPDIYNFVYGIWKGIASSNVKFIADGFNPRFETISGTSNFYKVRGGDAARLKGWKVLAAEDFNQRQLWSVFGAYLNGAINESYTVTRVGPDGHVYPTLVFRQKPFSSNHFEAPNAVKSKSNPSGLNFSHTKFSELPRWRVSPDIVYSIDLGKDEVSRINFVQLYGRSVAINDNVNQALQATNIFYDQEDIKRHGMKPAIITSNFDFPIEDGNKLQAKEWSYLLFDMLNQGHLREAGSIVTAGLVEPIAVGDNLEFDDAIYHIEAVSHTMAINPQNGQKQFRTNLTLSFGTALDSNRTTPVYPQMEHTDSFEERKRDYEEERILPGFSDTQYLPHAEGNSREKGEEVKETREASFTREAVPKSPKSRPGTLGYRKDGHREDPTKKGRNDDE